MKSLSECSEIHQPKKNISKLKKSYFKIMVNEMFIQRIKIRFSKNLCTVRYFKLKVEMECQV